MFPHPPPSCLRIECQTTLLRLQTAEYKHARFQTGYLQNDLSCINNTSVLNCIFCVVWWWKFVIIGIDIYIYIILVCVYVYMLLILCRNATCAHTHPPLVRIFGCVVLKWFFRHMQHAQTLENFYVHRPSVNISETFRGLWNIQFSGYWICSCSFV